MQEGESADAKKSRLRNLHLLQLIEGKRRSHYSPNPETLRKGFRGWHERGYLPHFDAPLVTQFLTVMLHDSFPVSRRREWEPVLKEPDSSKRRVKLEAWLDRGYGECWLRRPEIAAVVENELLSENTQTYLLRAWTIMPNHIHLVVDVWQTPLSRLLHLWKGRTARDANRLLGKAGTFWQADYFDTRVRDAEHLAKCIRYTESNPVKAYLVQTASQWIWGSASKRDEQGRLPWEGGPAA